MMPPVSVSLRAIDVGDRHRREKGDIEALAASIADVGLLHPIVLDGTQTLVAGWRRLLAVQSLGWEEVPVTVVDNLVEVATALRAERDENTCRLDFAPSEAVALGLALEALEQPKAVDRRIEGNRRGGVGGKLPPTSDPAKVRDVVGPAVGMSGRTYEKAKAVVAASKDRTLPAPVRQAAKSAVTKMDATGKVDRAYREVVQAREDDEAEGEVSADRARSMLRAAASRAISQASDNFLTLSPENVALVLDDDEWDDWFHFQGQINAWFDTLRANRPQPLRVVR